MAGRKHKQSSIELMKQKRRLVPNERYKNTHRIGAKHSDEVRRKISQRTKEMAWRGPQCHSWKGGIKTENEKDRHSFEYREWRRGVFERDGYTCQKCGDSKGGNLNAHHIKTFSEFKELRFDVDNGITVCEDCHNQIHRG